MKETWKNKGITIFFLFVIAVFTLVNLYEFLTKAEENGRLKGLGELGSINEAAITVWGGLQRFMGKELAFGSTVYEDVTRLNNGYFIMADHSPDYDAAVRGALGAQALADEIGAEFLYVQVPGKQRGEDLPEGVVCYSESKQEAVTEALLAEGVTVLDMGEVLRQSGEEWFSYFYHTDHHWNNDAAFLAYQNICAYMSENGSEIAEDLMDGQQYRRVLYEDVFLGTHGRMAGPWYTGLDDYELWLPEFSTSFSLEVATQGIHLEGDFEECFVHYENLACYSYDYYAYYAYLKEDYDCFEIVNHMRPEGPSVVIVRDSSAVPVSVFLATQCSELDILDLRYMEENNAMDYIREKNPDYIIYLFGTGYLGAENAIVMQ
ncbi:MAG: hypothetical protein IJZ00_05905 [Lachnospiraceae bacterium]|nr:hypothetical protein [Lachnospiraceae bacterium]